MRALPLRNHHGNVSNIDRHHAHALQRGDARHHQALPHLSPEGGLLRHKQFEERLPIQRPERDLGCQWRKRPLEEPKGRKPALLLRLQLHRLPRKRNRLEEQIRERHERSLPQRATRPRSTRHPSPLLSRHRDREGGLEAKLRAHHRDGCLGWRAHRPAQRGRALRGHHHRLLVRPRRGPTPGQALALRLGNSRPPHCAHSRKVACRGPRETQHRRRSTDQLARFWHHRLKPRRSSRATNHARPRLPRQEPHSTAQLRLWSPRSDGRALRYHPQRARQKIPLHPQLRTPQALLPIHEHAGRRSDDERATPHRKRR